MYRMSRVCPTRGDHPIACVLAVIEKKAHRIVLYKRTLCYVGLKKT